MNHEFLSRFLKLLLVVGLCFPASQAQTSAPTPVPTPFDATDQEKKICTDHNLSHSRCLQLALEFRRTRGLRLATPLAVDLDNPFTQTDDFAAQIAPKALLRLLESDVAQQAGRQILSLAAANNQIGGAPTANGSTNLVSKPTVTDFISAAAESGAFTDTVNGTTMTIQANAFGLTKYFANLPIFKTVENNRAADALQPLSFTVTLNVAQTGPSSATSTTGSANSSTPASITSILLPTNNASFSSFGANYSIYRPYNPQDTQFSDSWTKSLSKHKDAIQSASKTVAADVYKLFPQDVFNDVAQKMADTTSPSGAPLLQWHQAGAAAEQAGDFTTFVTAYSAYEDKYADVVLSEPDAPKNLLALSQAIDAFNQVVYSVLNDARGTPLATISYLYSAPPDKPATHSGTVVLSWLFQGGKWVIDPATGQKKKDDTKTFLSGAQLTGNFTASIYSSLPAGAAYGRLRDLQVSGEFDKPFGGTPAEPRGTWSLAGYGQYQYDPTVLNITAGNLVPGTNIALPSNAQVLLGTAGWLGVAQGKLVINLKQGLNIPIALKWSNKTDLLKGSDVRGQIGLSYDLSALSKLIAPSKN